jgi:hypothetical protein
MPQHLILPNFPSMLIQKYVFIHSHLFPDSSEILRINIISVGGREKTAPSGKIVFNKLK